MGGAILSASGGHDERTMDRPPCAFFPFSIIPQKCNQKCKTAESCAHGVRRILQFYIFDFLLPELIKNEFIRAKGGHFGKEGSTDLATLSIAAVAANVARMPDLRWPRASHIASGGTRYRAKTIADG